VCAFDDNVSFARRTSSSSQHSNNCKLCLHALMLLRPAATHHTHLQVMAVLLNISCTLILPLRPLLSPAPAPAAGALCRWRAVQGGPAEPGQPPRPRAGLLQLAAGDAHLRQVRGEAQGAGQAGQGRAGTGRGQARRPGQAARAGRQAGQAMGVCEQDL
jgi:hypothetical protein